MVALNPNERSFPPGVFPPALPNRRCSRDCSPSRMSCICGVTFARGDECASLFSQKSRTRFHVPWLSLSSGNCNLRKSAIPRRARFSSRFFRDEKENLFFYEIFTFTCDNVRIKLAAIVR